MAAYNTPSKVQCRGQFSSKDSCEELLEDMPASTGTEIFAPPSNESATVLLPQAVESGKLFNKNPSGWVSRSDRPLE